MDLGPWAYPQSGEARIGLAEGRLTLVEDDGTAFSIPVERLLAVNIHYQVTPRGHRTGKGAAKKHRRAFHRWRRQGPVHERAVAVAGHRLARIQQGATVVSVTFRSLHKWTRRERRSATLHGAHPALLDLAAEAARRASIQKHPDD